MTNDETPGAPSREEVKKGLIYLTNMSVGGLVTPVVSLRDGLKLAVDQGLTEAMPELARDVNHGLATLGMRIAGVDSAVQALAEACVKAHEAAKEIHAALPPVFASALDEGVRQAKRAAAIQSAVGAQVAKAATKATGLTPGGIIVAS